MRTVAFSVPFIPQFDIFMWNYFNNAFLKDVFQYEYE